MRTRSHAGPRPSRTRRFVAAGATATIAVLAVGVLTAPAAQAADPVTIDLVTVNDFHGRIEAVAPAGGIAALATAVNQIRSANPNTVFAAAGDMIGASTFTSFIQQDTPTIDSLNAAGLDVSSVGNHEFDKGWADLRDRVQGLADWEYLASNVFLKGTNTPALPEYWTTTLGGVTVGFVGAVTNELPSLVSPAGIADLEVRDVTENVNRVAGRLSDGNAANGEADVVVLLVHEGAAQPTIAAATDPASPFGRIVNGVDGSVDAIVSGHTHLAYNFVIDGRPVISSGQYGEKFSDMKIQVDPDTKQILSMVNTTYDMYTQPPGTPAPPPVANYAPDQTVKPIVDKAVADAEPLGAVQLGSITADFSRSKLANGTTENRGAESTLGNFVADAQLWAAQRTDPSVQITFMNAGGLRTDMLYAPDGVLTYKEAALVQPFANTLVAMTLTGEQIKSALEQQWQPASAARPMLKLGTSKGLTYTFDPNAAAGSRISNIQFNGAAVDPGASFRVAVNSFLASGGDNFAALGQGTAKADTGQVDLQAMVDYMDFVTSASPDYAQRSIGLVMSPPTAQGYAVGSTIDLNLSALDFTTTEPKSGTVTVTIGGKPAGSAVVDSTVGTSNLDVVGTASLSVTVPAGVKGTVPLSITTATGTKIDVPITVYEKAGTVTFGFPNKLIAKQGAAIQYTVGVAGGTTYPTGTITVFDGGQAIATATLTAAQKGVAKIALPALAKGIHRLSATYSGDDLHKTSTSVRIPLLIL